MRRCHRPQIGLGVATLPVGSPGRGADCSFKPSILDASQDARGHRVRTWLHSESPRTRCPRHTVGAFVTGSALGHE